MKYLSLIVSSLLLVSCADKKIQPSAISTEVLKEKIFDLQVIPQNVDYYTHDVTPLATTQTAYEKEYFRVWNLSKIDLSLEDALWAHKLYSEKNSYGENLRPRESSFFKNILENANYKAFATVNKNAITLERLNLRAMPSDKPILLDPTRAGEGFPFDYLQNSAIAPNKPLLISHYSKDKKWVFVESSFAYGWVHFKDIVVLSKKYTDLWQKAKQIFLTKDRVPLYTEKGTFLFNSQIGMMLALIDEDEKSYTVLTLSKYRENQPLFHRSKISKSVSHKGKMLFNAKNINVILKELNKSKYGWGGMYNERDCSSTLRDFYAPFALWLPRNSYKQSLAGETISVENLTTEEKIQIIKEKGVPFHTLIYKRGHIGLYVGEFNNQVIFYQNVWGVKTNRNGIEGRFIIGKPIFSTLEVGKNLQDFDKNASILAKLKSITKL